MIARSGKNILLDYSRPLAYATGLLIVTVWTIFRHIANGVNYDVVGQIGVTEQWMHGQALGAQFGATNYLLKVPLYFLINSLHFISPANRLLLAALVVNVATFVLLFFIFEKTVKLYAVKNEALLYIVMVWLATLGGNIFWLDYANSRNLEVVGGLFLLLLFLQFLQTRQRSKLVWFSVIGSIVFFADPLQLYVFGPGIVLFVIIQCILKRPKYNLNLVVGTVIAVATSYMVAKLITFGATKLLPVSFLTTSDIKSPLSFSYIHQVLSGLLVGTLKIFGADFLTRPYSLSSIRELGNAAVLVGVIIVLVRTRGNKKHLAVKTLLLLLIACNYIAYVASGQVGMWETERYLIMVPFLTFLLVCIQADYVRIRRLRAVVGIWLLLIVISSALVFGGLIMQWRRHSDNNAFVTSLITFMKENHFTYALSSREVGVTTTYLSDNEQVVLPMACSPAHTLYGTNLFYDKASFEELNDYAGDVPVIIPAGGINFGTVCSSADILKQLGPAKRVMSASNGSTVLVYNNMRLLSSGALKVE